MSYQFTARHNRTTNEGIQAYVTSPRTMTRVWCGVFFLGLPVLFLLSLAFNPSPFEPLHEQDALGQLGLVIFAALCVASFGEGIYLVFFINVVSLDAAGDQVARTIRIWGMTVHRKVWRLSDFERIEARHRSCGDGPSDFFQTDVGIRHSSGLVLWMRGFVSKSNYLAGEALAFADKLSETTGLPYEQE